MPVSNSTTESAFLFSPSKRMPSVVPSRMASRMVLPSASPFFDVFAHAHGGLPAVDGSDPSASAFLVFLWFGSDVDEASDVFLEFLEVRLAHVHHVACLVILVPDVLADVFRQAHVVHGVFRLHEWRCQVVDSVLHFHLQTRIGNHGLHQVQHHARGTREKAKIVALVFPIPAVPAKLSRWLVGFVLSKLQFFA